MGEAIEIAVKAHRNARDKGGAPYILHPLRLMFRMRTEVEMMAAVLHDVLEDCKDRRVLRRVRSRAPKEVLEALDCLTRRPREAYERFIQRVKSNSVAIRVKLADLEDNLDVSRLSGLRKKDAKRLQKYQRAHRELRGGS